MSINFSPVRLRTFLFILCVPFLRAAEPALRPLTVCEVMADLPSYDGKIVAVLGRFSFRQGGRWLGEQKCAQRLVLSGQEWPDAFWVEYDPQRAPKPPSLLSVDSVLLDAKLKQVKQGTPLTNLPFGSVDYDNWALVYGRVETRKDLMIPSAAGNRKNGYGFGESSPARIVCHGAAMVVFLNE